MIDQHLYEAGPINSNVDGVSNNDFLGRMAASWLLENIWFFYILY
jgi:hypothetical protein